MRELGLVGVASQARAVRGAADTWEPVCCWPSTCCHCGRGNQKQLCPKQVLLKSSLPVASGPPGGPAPRARISDVPLWLRLCRGAAQGRPGPAAPLITADRLLS